MSKPSGSLSLRINDRGNAEYVLMFDYKDQEAINDVYHVINDLLLPYYGATSNRAAQGGSYLKPFLIDENGVATTENQGIIGGMSIPKDLLDACIDRFTHLDQWDLTVDVGNGQLDARDMQEDGFFKEDNPMLDQLPPIGPTINIGDPTPCLDDCDMGAGSDNG